MVATSSNIKKTIKKYKQTKQLVKDVDAIVKQYDELTTATQMYTQHIRAVYSQYDKQLIKMKKDCFEEK